MPTVDVARRLPARVLITGGAGCVAGWLVRTAPTDVQLHVTEHRTPVPPDVGAVARVHRTDLRRSDEVLQRIVGIRPEVILHTAYVQSERAAIVDATQAVARAAQVVGASLVHLSTDVVFAGDRPPYDETATPDATSDYGRWKAEAERRSRIALPDVCTTRTSLVVSLDPPDRISAGLADALAAGREVPLFFDEMRLPIRAEDLAAELWRIVALPREERAGVWHLPGPEHMSRLELGRRVAALLGLDAASIRPTSAAAVAPGRPRDPALVGSRRARLGVGLRAVDAR